MSKVMTSSPAASSPTCISTEKLNSNSKKIRKLIDPTLVETKNDLTKPMTSSKRGRKPKQSLSPSTTSLKQQQPPPPPIKLLNQNTTITTPNKSNTSGENLLAKLNDQIKSISMFNSTTAAATAIVNPTLVMQAKPSTIFMNKPPILVTKRVNLSISPNKPLMSSLTSTSTITTANINLLNSAKTTTSQNTLWVLNGQSSSSSAGTASSIAATVAAQVAKETINSFLRQQQQQQQQQHAANSMPRITTIVNNNNNTFTSNTNNYIVNNTNNYTIINGSNLSSQSSNSSSASSTARNSPIAIKTSTNQVILNKTINLDFNAKTSENLFKKS
jgi:hypothetical protein